MILVGEMREMETISLAITAAEMGMLVFGTLHTNNAAKTIDRIIDAFPAEEQNMVRLSLSESLAGIVSQLLLPRADTGGRIAANEILLKTAGLPNIIRDGNTPMLGQVIQAGKSQGMQAMDDVLFAYAKEGKVVGAGCLHEGGGQVALRAAAPGGGWRAAAGRLSLRLAASNAPSVDDRRWPRSCCARACRAVLPMDERPDPASCSSL